MKRLFTFGCSFTQYYWPTWADILGREFDYFENWGQCGGGNQFIFNSLIECNTRHKFTSSDTVIVMVTSVAREDRYINDNWVTPGNLLTQSFYTDGYVKKIFCDRGFLIRDIATISAIFNLLKSCGVNYEVLSMMPLIQIDQYNKNNNNGPIIADILTLYNDTLQNIKPSVYETIFNGNWGSKSSEFLSPNVIERVYKNTYANEYYQWLHGNRNLARPDSHPTPQEHLDYIEKILPYYAISTKTRTWINNYSLSDNFEKHFPNRL